ncbi:MAG: hypothetical protein ACO2ZZ_00890 [Cyclobacteriaceae bacterium]
MRYEERVGSCCLYQPDYRSNEYAQPILELEEARLQIAVCGSGAV